MMLASYQPLALGWVVAAVWTVGGVASILSGPRRCPLDTRWPRIRTVPVMSHIHLLEANAVTPFVIIRTQLLMNDDHRRCPA